MMAFASDHHSTMLQQFRWQVPPHFNIAHACSARWASHSHSANRVAVITHCVDAPALTHSFAQLQAAAHALSHVFWHVYTCIFASVQF
jgi:acetyl-CoA synthetase